MEDSNLTITHVPELISGGSPEAKRINLLRLEDLINQAEMRTENMDELALCVVDAFDNGANDPGQYCKGVLVILEEQLEALRFELRGALIFAHELRAYGQEWALESE